MIFFGAVIKDFSTRWRSVEMTKEIPGQAGNDVGQNK